MDSSSLRLLTLCYHLWLSFFFFTDPPTAELYTLSLHDALTISARRARAGSRAGATARRRAPGNRRSRRPWLPRTTSCRDRKSTRLNSSHITISYAVFCLKKKKKRKQQTYKLRAVCPSPITTRIL